MYSVKSRKGAHTRLTAWVRLVQRTSNLSAVPWGTREQVLGNEYERLGKGDLYGSVSDGREASPLDEPRTPCILCRGVSDLALPHWEWVDAPLKVLLYPCPEIRWKAMRCADPEFVLVRRDRQVAGRARVPPGGSDLRGECYQYPVLPR